jgi:hypothetical protein
VLSSYERAGDLLTAALPDGPVDLRASRLDQMTTLLVGTVAGWEWRRHRGEAGLTLEVLCADLTATIAALLTAPTTLTTDPRPETR